MSAFVRWQSPTPGERGVCVGVFGLLNVLGRRGLLSDEDEQFRRRENAWYDAAYTDPSTVDPSVYDRETNPGAVAWFRTGATHLVERVPAYVEVLERYDVDCVRVESDDPGRVVYEDAEQVVVVPHDA